MVGWHHRLNGYEFEQAPGVGDGQGSLVCCSPRGHKELDTTERLLLSLHLSAKCNKQQKLYRQKTVRRDGKNTQKSYTKKILMTQITTIVGLLT